MAGLPGTGSLVWSTLTGVFSAEAGFGFGKSVAEVKCTTDTDTTETYVAGNLPDNGQATGTIFLEDGVDWRVLVGTSSALTHTNANNDVTAGTAFLVSGTETDASNKIIEIALVFRFEGAVTFTPGV